MKPAQVKHGETRDSIWSKDLRFETRGAPAAQAPERVAKSNTAAGFASEDVATQRLKIDIDK